MTSAASIWIMAAAPLPQLPHTLQLPSPIFFFFFCWCEQPFSPVWPSAVELLSWALAAVSAASGLCQPTTSRLQSSWDNHQQPAQPIPLASLCENLAKINDSMHIRRYNGFKELNPRNSDLRLTFPPPTTAYQSTAYRTSDTAVGSPARNSAQHLGLSRIPILLAVQDTLFHAATGSHLDDDAAVP